MKTLAIAALVLLSLQLLAQQKQPSCCPDVPTAEKQAVLNRKLEAEVHRISDRLDGVMGVAILDLNTGESTSLLHPDDVFAQASSIKIAVLAELYRQDQSTGSGAHLDDAYTVRKEDMVPDSDIMLGLTPGVTKLTNRDLATMMIAVSDNSATNVLIDRVGMENVNKTLRGLGLKQTALRRKMMDLKAAAEGRENVSTPREMMAFLAALYQGNLLDKPHTDAFFKMLAMHKDDYAARALPDDVMAATKPGALEAVRNSSGVIFVEGRPFVLCVMTAYAGDERAAEQAIGDVALAAYRHFSMLARATPYGRVISPGNSGTAPR
ncbi:MAG: serine hydrolase [Candidatus Koribacter versatilis]|uniref:beta-lactamase n=1 Tax=Candidatus Korobacter versatilis TaxID=658062 RepID=A0A932A8H4_9BACT|nr:serine hydrolase [Candidatus Koribacter versatilis]